MIATQMLMFLLCENLTEEFTTKLKYRSIIFCYERNSPGKRKFMRCQFYR